MTEAVVNGYRRRLNYSLLASVLFHGALMGGGLGLFYSQAEFGVAPGGRMEAHLVGSSDLVSEVFKPRPQVAAPDSFVIPKKQEASPRPQEEAAPRPAVEGNPGAGEGFGQYTTQPGYFRNPFPPYPAALRAQGVEGQVLLEVHLDEQGRVQDVVLLQSSGFPEFDRSAQDTILNRWRFRPARIGPLKVPSRVQIPIRFEIQQ